MFFLNMLIDMYIICYLRYRLVILWKVKRVYIRLIMRKCYLDFCIFFKVLYVCNEVYFWLKKGFFIINLLLIYFFIINFIVYCWCFFFGVWFVFMKRMDRDFCFLLCEEIGIVFDVIKFGLILYSVVIFLWVVNRLLCYYCIFLVF